MNSIHISDVRAFLKCRRSWDWSSQMRQNLERKYAYAPFFTGRIIHSALQHYYEGTHSIEEGMNKAVSLELKKMQRLGALWPQEREIIDEQLDLIYGMLKHYEMTVPNEYGPWSDSNLEFLALETEFSVPLYSNGKKVRGYKLEGRFDGVVRRKDDKTLWVFETKTTRSIKELMDSLVNDNQAGAYLIAAQRLLGQPFAGVLYNILRKKLPTAPAILKSGDLSQNASIDTTAEAYIQYAMAHHGIDRVAAGEKYHDFLIMLLNRGNEFFQRIPVFRTPIEMVNLEEELVTVMKEMTSKKLSIYTAPNWMNCKFCSFRSPCLLMMSGGNYEDVIANEYAQRVSWEEEDENVLRDQGR